MSPCCTVSSRCAHCQRILFVNKKVTDLHLVLVVDRTCYGSVLSLRVLYFNSYAVLLLELYCVLKLFFFKSISSVFPRENGREEGECNNIYK